MRNRKMSAIAGTALLSGVLAGSAKATIFMDQIGTTPTTVTGQTAYLSQVFQSALAAGDTGVVDDFSVAGKTLLTSLFSVEKGFGSNFSSFSTVTTWDVEIYSSLTAASASLLGDVYNHAFLPASVSLTTPFGGDSSSALLNITTAIVLPSAGKYYLAILASNSSADGEIGVYATTGVSGSTPGGLNAYQSNPSGGLGFPSNPHALNLDAAYAVTGTAIPEPAAAVGVGFVSIIAVPVATAAVNCHNGFR